MKPTTDRERLKALVTQRIIFLLEQDVYGGPEAGPAVARGSPPRSCARKQAAGEALLLRTGTPSR